MARMGDADWDSTDEKSAELIPAAGGPAAWVLDRVGRGI